MVSWRSAASRWSVNFDGHSVISESFVATKVPPSQLPVTTTSRPSLNWSGTWPR